MDIREHFIPSLFFHVIGVLLLAALSQSQVKGGPQALTLSLSAGLSERASSTGQTKEQGTKESAVPSRPMVAEDEAAITESPAEENAAKEERPPVVSEPEKAPEAFQAAAPGMAGPGQDPSGLAFLHHAFAIYTRVYVEQTALSLGQALSKEMVGDPPGALNDGTAEVIFYFNDDGRISEARGASDSDKLLSALVRLDWKSVPLPGAYGLRMKGLHVAIKIDKGAPTFFFTAL